MFNSLYFRNITNYINNVQTFYRLTVKITEHKNLICFKSFQSSFKRTFKTNNIREYDQQVKFDPLYVKTNVQNNVILFKYENPRYFTIFKVFCIGWTSFASVLSYCTFDPRFISAWSNTKSIGDYIKETGTSLLYFLYALITGPAAFLLLYMVNKKYVKYLILHKGGRDVSIITYHLFKHQEVTTLPVDKISTMGGRNRMKNYLPIKAKGKMFYYLLDADGKFLNEELFDYTIGIKKHW